MKPSKKVVIVPEKTTKIESYTEGQDGYLEVTYIGNSELRIRGCKTGKLYSFGKGIQRPIDANDAHCLPKGLFVYSVKEDAKSDNSKDKVEFERFAE